MPAQTFREGVSGQPRSFLSSQAVTQTDKTISNLIYRGLFKYDIYGVLIPDLADSWTISDDNTVYTIKLKPGQLWTDGTEINADDLIYTSYKVSDLNGIATDKVDNLTVRYTLPNKYSPFLSLLAGGVIQNGSEEVKSPLNPVTSGDFRVIHIEKSGPLVKEVVLYNARTPLKKLAFRYYASDTELELAAKLGEVDGFVSTRSPDLENFAEYKYPMQGVSYALLFNLSDELLKDKAARETLREVLPIEEVTESYGISVQGPISRSIFTDRSINFDRYNAKSAKSLKTGKITITVPDVKKQRELAEKIKDVWEEETGFDVGLDIVDPDIIVSEVVQDRKFQVLLFGQEVSRDPDRYPYWHSTQTAQPGLNITGFSHIRADRALEEGRNEIDSEKRFKHYSEFQKTVMDNVPAIFLYHPFAHYYVNKYFTGMGEKYTFTAGDRFLDFANWRRVQTN